MLQGALLPVVGVYWFWYLLSGIFLLIGGNVMRIVNPETPISRVYGFTLFIAIGAGFAGQGGYALAAAKAHSRFLHDNLCFMALTYF